ncbi:hypothetical protein [Sphingomonas sp. URHD0057]|uniref:hypothetical protein n=1 Tax=Sphingomonas sp. URHD0057 TaxID=1380389 RepID=UPI000B104312|nr:hypothetical protein [Sphingomonas sp. URHD0057]
MAHMKLIAALSLIVPASPLVAQPDTDPIVPATTATAPAGTADTRYCMHVDPNTGSLVETTECWTRAEWAEQGVDVDKEWAREGVRVLA